MEKQKPYKEAPPNKQFGTKLSPGSLWACAVEYLTPAGMELPCPIPWSQLENVHCQRPQGTEDVVFNCRITRGDRDREGFSSCCFFQTSLKKEIYVFQFHLLSPSISKVRYKPRDQRTQNSGQDPDISKPLSLLCCDTSKKQQTHFRIVVNLIFKREGQRCSTEHSNCQTMFKANLFPFIRSQRNVFVC